MLTKTPTESLEKKTPSTILPIRRVAQSFPPFFKILLPPKYFSEKISRFKHTNEGDFSNVRKRPSTLSTDQIRTNISIKSSPKLSKTTNFIENKRYSHLKQREISAENSERQIFSPNQDQSIESLEQNNKQFYTDKLTKNQNNSSSNISGNKLGIPFNLSPSSSEHEALYDRISGKLAPIPGQNENKLLEDIKPTGLQKNQSTFTNMSFIAPKQFTNKENSQTAGEFLSKFNTYRNINNSDDGQSAQYFHLFLAEGPANWYRTLDDEVTQDYNSLKQLFLGTFD